jgi:hypothetical protein
MEARTGLGFEYQGKPWLLLDRRGDDSKGTILNEMCHLVRRNHLFCMPGKGLLVVQLPYMPDNKHWRLHPRN